MMHRAWSSIVEVPYCFSRPHVKFQGHTALKIVEFDPNWAFPDSNSSLNSPMAMKCCTKLETAKERCPIVFQGHPSNFKVTRDKTSPILTQIGRFRTIGRSQLSNPSDLPCFKLSECWSPVEYHIHIILVSLQFSCGDNYQMLIQFNRFDLYSCKIQFIHAGDIIYFGKSTPTTNSIFLGQVIMYIYTTEKWEIIGLDSGLLPTKCQTII